MDIQWKQILISLFVAIAGVVMSGSVMANASSSQQALVTKLQEGISVRLWPGVAPGSGGLVLPEEVVERNKEPDKIKDRAVVKVLNPTMTVHLPLQPTGLSILVIPGGSYQRIAIDKEGEDLVPWLSSIGVTFFILQYRLPGDGHKQGRDVPLQDAQRAIRLIRKNATAWGIDPKRIGVMGFSAGGHIASGLAVKNMRSLYAPVDSADYVSARPDFLILGYPVVTMLDPYAHAGCRTQLLGASPDRQAMEDYSNELLVTRDTPDAFIMHANDDSSVPAENSVLFYSAMRKVGAAAELHIFKDGGHGFGIRAARGKPAEEWTSLCSKWLKASGYMK